MKKQYLLTLGLTLFILFAASAAFAAQGLPWEAPLTTLRTSLNGPVAFAIALVAIFATGSMLIFGGEINEFTKRGSYVVLVLGILVAAVAVLNVLYPAATGAGAVI